MGRLLKAMPELALLALGLGAGLPPRAAAGAEAKAVLIGHTDEVYAVAFSPDGKTLASAGRDGSIRLWDKATGKERAVLIRDVKDDDRDHTVFALAFSPDGKTLASGGHDATVRLWDTATGRSRGTLKAHTSSVFALAYSPDGATLASGGYDGTVRLWDPVTGRARATLKPADGSLRVVQCLAFSPDGKTLASGDTQDRVRLWDVAAGKGTHAFRGDGSAVRALAFSPDGKAGASVSTHNTSDDGTIRLWNASTGEARVSLKGDRGNVRALAYGPGGKTLAAGTESGILQVWDMAAGKERAAVRAADGSVECLAYSPDGKALATGGRDRKVRLWDVATLTDPVGGTDPVKRHFRSVNYWIKWGTPTAVPEDAELEVGGGGGHGSGLEWHRFRPGKDWVEVLAVRLEDARDFATAKASLARGQVVVRRADMKAGAYAALLRDLAVVSSARLKPAEGVPGAFGTADFWVQACLTAGPKMLLDLNWAGYPSHRDEVESAKPQAATALAQEAVVGLAFKDHTPTAEERGWASSKFARDWKRFQGLEHHWWVRERYIQTIGLVGDKAALPTLRDILASEPPKDKRRGASEERCMVYAVTAVGRLTKTDLWGPRGEEGEVEAARRKALDLLRDRK